MTRIVALARPFAWPEPDGLPASADAETRYRLLFETARDAIVILRDGDLVASNPAARELFGCDEASLTGPFLKRFSPEFQPDGRLSQKASRERVTLALRGIPQLFAWRHLRKDGRPVDTEISLNRIGSESERTLQAVIRDITHRTAFEEAIRTSENRFRGLFENMVEGASVHQLVYGPDGTAEDYIIEGVNPAFERIVGLSGASVTGSLASKAFGTDTPPYLEIYAGVVETGLARNFETFFTPLGRHFTISAFPIGPGRFATVFSDVTETVRTEAELARSRATLGVLLGKRDLELVEANEQVQEEVQQRLAAEASLKESEARYRSVFEHNGAGMVILEADMTIFLANAEMERITGYRREELEGKMNGLDLLSPDDAKRLRGERQRRLDGGLAPNEYECRLQRRDGEVRHILLKVGAIFGTDKAVGSLIDITERKAAQAALERSEDNYRSLFEHAGAPTMILEADMTIAMINPPFEALFGYSRKEVEGRMPWTRLVHPDDVQRMKAYHRERRRPGGNAPSKYDCRFVDREGRVRDIHIKVGMLPDGRRSIGSLIDLTDRLRAETSLRRSQSQLSHIIDATAGFIYTVDADYRIGFINKTLADKIGRDARGERCYQAFHHRDRPCEDCPSQAVFRGETAHAEVRSASVGRWFYTLQSPVFDDKGQVTEKQVVALDITERKLAEEAMREKEGLLQKENQRLRANMKDRYRFGDIVGKSQAMQRVYDLILKAAGSGANAIVTGESGTGKELVARAIHDMSDRRSKPFVPVNTGAIPEHLLESEFFGYKKGAFTGAASDKLGFLDIADGGTLFLDEVGELGLAMQVKLLRAIEGGGFLPLGGRHQRKPDVRIVAATNRDLTERVAAGAMREDFYYRIHVIPIHLPPLRKRKEDIALLAEHFLQGLAGDESAPRLNGNLLEKLYRYHWPGNVRELENVLSRYLTLQRIDFQDASPRPASPAPISSLPAVQADPQAKGLKDAVEDFEKRLIRHALEANGGQKAKTADFLGIHRKTLFTKMRQYNLDEA